MQKTIQTCVCVCICVWNARIDRQRDRQGELLVCGMCFDGFFFSTSLSLSLFLFSSLFPTPKTRQHHHHITRNAHVNDNAAQLVNKERIGGEAADKNQGRSQKEKKKFDVILSIGISMKMRRKNQKKMEKEKPRLGWVLINIMG